MITLVCFRNDQAEFGVAIESVREVRSRGSLLALPAPRPGVVGLVQCEGRPVPVLDEFGKNQHHVLLLDHDNGGFGLLVEMVTRVVAVDDPMGPAPRGQERDYIAGVVSCDGEPVFVIDVEALDERLGR